MFDMRIKEERQYKTDGTVIVQGFPIANWEFKNEFFGNRTCPVAQIRLQKEQKDHPPMLLVSVDGCHYLHFRIVFLQLFSRYQKQKFNTANFKEVLACLETIKIEADKCKTQWDQWARSTTSVDPRTP